MKKLLVVLLSLGLLVAFGATASAADVKFSGSYYVVGTYENNVNLAGTSVGDTSRAFFYQRVRLQPVFQIADGLTFTVRMDALEKQWGQTDWRTGFDDKESSRRQFGNSGIKTTTPTAPAVYTTGSYTGMNPKIQENFEFERAIVTFKTAAGVFDVGYQSSGKWGTDYGDDEQTRARIKFSTAAGPMSLIALYEKTFESDTSTNGGVLNTTTGAVTYPYQGKADADEQNVAFGAIYNFKGGATGLLYKYAWNNSGRVLSNYKQAAHIFIPYLKATFGPVYVEGEVVYIIGNYRKYDSGATPDVDFDRLGAWLLAKANIGPAYFGASYLFTQGDNGSDPTKFKTGPNTTDLNPALLLGNDEYQTWANKSAVQASMNGAAFSSDKYNVHMFSVFGGFNPNAKSNMELAFIAASADKVPTGYVSKSYGMEIDAKASYKIYDNLTYMVGAAYLWTGDYFKGTSDTNTIGNDYLLMNRLSLSF